MITWSRTSRGFMRGEFKDYYGNKCSIQKSSLHSPTCVWLGVEHERHDPDGVQCGARMHLSRDMVLQLLEELKFFVDTSQVHEL